MKTFQGFKFKFIVKSDNSIFQETILVEDASKKAAKRIALVAIRAGYPDSELRTLDSVEEGTFTVNEIQTLVGPGVHWMN